MSSFGKRASLVAAALVVLMLGAFALGFFGARKPEEDARRTAESKGYRDGEEAGKREGRTAGRKAAPGPPGADEPALGGSSSTVDEDPDPTDGIDPSDEGDCPSTGPLPLERRRACGLL